MLSSTMACSVRKVALSGSFGGYVYGLRSSLQNQESRVPVASIPSIFTRNTLHCLISALHGQDRYLRKASQNALATLGQRAEFTAPEDWKDIIGSIITKLIINTDFADFDKLTKTATVTTLLASEHASAQSEVFQSLSQLLRLHRYRGRHEEHTTPAVCSRHGIQSFQRCPERERRAFSGIQMAVCLVQFYSIG